MIIVITILVSIIISSIIVIVPCPGAEAAAAGDVADANRDIYIPLRIIRTNIYYNTPFV